MECSASPHGSHFVPVGAFYDLSLVISLESKSGMGGRDNQQCLSRQLPRDAIKVSSGKAGLISGWGLLLLAEKTLDISGFNVPSFIRVFPQSPHSFSVSALTLTVDTCEVGDSNCFVIQPISG